MALIDHFLPPVAFAAMLASEENLADIPFETARADMDRLLDEALAKARRHTPQQADDALFAVCAFADEAVLDSTWPGREAWMRHKLQETRFQTGNAGLEFYERMAPLYTAQEDAANAAQREALEVFVACLTLGFRGGYSDHPDKVAQLLGAYLPKLMDDRGPAHGKLFPETYAAALPAPQPSRLGPALRFLIFFGAPLLLTIGIYAAYDSVLSFFVRRWLAGLG